ncbi:MAG: cytochrome c3 family protein [Anaerolineales bacterium]|jgi:hypothetical protein
MTRKVFLVIAVILILFAAWAVITRMRVYAAPEQPLKYSHRVHVEAGIQCLYCHPNALRSTVAGVPSVQKCMGCHEVIATDNPVVVELTGYWERGEPVPWKRVNLQPDFVYFSHQPHMGAGMSCESCHGAVGQMDAVQPVYKMDMGWCLDCHLEQPEEKVARLADCLICHK